MKSTFVLSVPVVAMLALAGCASNPQGDQRVAQNATATPKTNISCIKDTGSRIKPKEGECRGPGRTYSREDLDRTGAFDTAEALRKLDPSL